MTPSLFSGISIFIAASRWKQPVTPQSNLNYSIAGTRKEDDIILRIWPPPFYNIVIREVLMHMFADRTW